MLCFWMGASLLKSCLKELVFSHSPWGAINCEIEGKESEMKDVLKKFLTNGKIKISKEKERAFYFYVTIGFFIYYLITTLDSWT